MSETVPDAAEIEQVLDRIPDAFAHAEEGRVQARLGEGVPLDALMAPPEPEPEQP